jgi:hypothetical protein
MKRIRTTGFFSDSLAIFEYPFISSMATDLLKKAFSEFDLYNAKDPHEETVGQQVIAKELLYAVRMTEKLSTFSPGAGEHVQLAARCQHIGRWEIPRATYPMDRKGYLQWRSELKMHHAAVAEKILHACGYDEAMIEKVKFLVLKKQLFQNPETQLLEDVICLVFIQHYLEDFAQRHEEEKVVDILKKTLKKMSTHAIQEALKLPMTDEIKALILKAAKPV